MKKPKGKGWVELDCPICGVAVGYFNTLQGCPLPISVGPCKDCRDKKEEPEIRYQKDRNDDIFLDEVIAHNCYLHMEQLNTGHFWFGITINGRRWCLHLTTKNVDRTPITARIEED